MKIFCVFLVLVAFVAGLPVSAPIAGDIGDRPVDFNGRPIDGRPVEGRPVEPRPIDSRPIGTRGVEAGQENVPGAYIIEFKEGYTHEAFKAMMADKKINYDTRVIFNTPKVLVGISIQLTNFEDYVVVKAWEGVLNIWPVTIVTIPEEPPFFSL
ncbi:uncharacterized protein BDR25DRAFT_346906 [Lindgomyces ingoldianus]|uniref:Uncharacterized protein n=1 Tax=Lindgomyces ingoldianus TaxID=673940 RepID=A0ACB6QB11_9PLEO|nr:uncharacterized protein BDR25DRAFT_346906 [Lindgomyces ingoldianus]KAF2464118.1 hypothetical protein BDR25DRAFT_346906 [Lindgomyces ingoldianus]